MQDAPTDPDAGTRYAITVAGRLGAQWSAWFDGMRLTPQADGTTVISGPVVDQACLHGLLQKARDLGIPLVAVTRLDPPGPRRSTS